MRGDLNEQSSNLNTAVNGEKQGAIEHVLRNVFCPKCQYNLRGLSGNQVRCPECGNDCNITQLVSMKWTKPWYRAPYFNSLSIPIFAGVSSYLAVLVLDFNFPAIGIFQQMATFGFLGWLGSFYFPYRVFKSARGILLSILMHLVFLGYAVGSTTFLICIMTLIAGIATSTLAMASEFLTAIFFLIGSMFVLWLSRKGEKFVAYKCIDHYLNRIYEKSITD